MKTQCRVLEVSEQGYYKWRRANRSVRAQSDHKLLVKIRRIFLQHKQRYGSPRIFQTLKKRGGKCGENRVAQLMREDGLRAKAARKIKVTTDSWRSKRIPAENILNREFYPTAPNKVWCGDITYIWTEEGWVYLAVFIDLYARKIVGWATSKSLNRELVLRAFSQAVKIRNPGSELIVHTDRGSQYTSDDFVSASLSLCRVPI